MGFKKLDCLFDYRFVTKWGLIAKACASSVHKIKKLLSMEFAPTSLFTSPMLRCGVKCLSRLCPSSTRLVFAGYTGVTIPSQFTSVYKLHFALLGYLLWDFTLIISVCFLNRLGIEGSMLPVPRFLIWVAWSISGGSHTCQVATIKLVCYLGLFSIS